MKSDIVVQLRMNSECLAPSIMLAAADEIERLREERDAARREICWMLEYATNDPQEEHAKFWGWDCFSQEDKPCQ
jgi:hypothetical protein